MFCAKCGKQIPENTKFCVNCGEPVGQDNQSHQVIGQSGQPNQVIINTGNGQGSGLAVASLVCGILSMVFCCVSFLGLILGVLAVVFGVIVLVSGSNGKGMAIAGILTGSIGFVIIMVAGASIASMLESYM